MAIGANLRDCRRAHDIGSMTLALLVLAAACGNGSATPQPAAGSNDRGGAAVYAVYCAQCHGTDAQGYKSDHAPSLVNPTFLASATDLFLTRSIEVGRPGTAMAGYAKAIGGPLTVAAVQGIVTWLRASGRLAATLDAATPGDATRGQPLYAANCQKCHGDQTTRGDAIHLANARFLDIATAGFMRHAIVNGRPGTPMEAWRGKLSDQDIADVIAYVRAFATQLAQAGQLPAPTGTEPLFINPDGKDPVFKPRSEACPAGAACKNDPRFVPADQLKQALDQQRKLVIIDARPASEWMRVHITGAVSIPYHDLKRLDEIPKDAWVIAYCACPHHLSGIIVDELQRRGYPHAFVLDEGILEWQRRGYTIVAAPGVPMPPKEPLPAPGTIR